MMLNNNKQKDGEVEILFEVNNNLKKDDLDQVDNLTSNQSNESSNDLNNKDLINKKPGKKLIEHKNKVSSLSGVNNIIGNTSEHSTDVESSLNYITNKNTNNDDYS